MESLFAKPSGRYTGDMQKDVWLIFIGFALALIAGALIMFSFKEQASAPQVGEVSFSVIATGSQADMIEQRKNYRVKNAEELAALWVMVHGTDGPNLPQIDFETEEVLAVFEGTRPTGGYAVAVASVVDGDTVRAVELHHTIPDESCMVSQALTSPYALVRLPKTEAKIERTDVEVVAKCE